MSALVNVLSESTMHDPKMSAVVAHHPLVLSESVLDKHGHTRPAFHLTSDHFDQARGKTLLALPRREPSHRVPEDVADVSGQRSYYHRMKEFGGSLSSEVHHFPGQGSVLSSLAAQYRYSDWLYASRLYAALYDPNALPLGVAAFPHGLLGNHVCPDRERSGIVIKDYPSLPPSLPPSSISSRAADTLSLSPLQVSTSLASTSPSSSQSSPSPHRRSSVSPDSHQQYPNLRLVASGNSRLISALPRNCMPSTLQDDRHLHEERKTYPAALTPSLPPQLGRSSGLLLRPGPLTAPPFLSLYESLKAPYECREGAGHLLEHYLSTPSILDDHHHLHRSDHHHLHRSDHHHLHRSDHHLHRSDHLLHHHQRHHLKDSFYYGTSIDPRASPGKELPTKVTKQDRSRDRQELAAVLEADREHADRLNNVKKSASTQTQFSSFSCENLPPPPYYTTHDTITKLHTSSSHGHPYPHHLPPPPPPPPPLISYSSHPINQLPPLPLHHHHPTAPPPPHMLSSSLLQGRHLHLHPESLPASAVTPALPTPPHIRQSPPMTPKALPPYHSSPLSCSPAPPPQYTELTRVHVDVQHAPLNLSLSSAPPNSSVTPPSRASFNPSGSASPDGGAESCRDGAEADEASNQRFSYNNNGSSHETAAQVSDEAIEEHFRRSLGKCYTEPASPKKVTVHVSEKICSVDDHFARALGDQMWTEIKARSEPAVEALSGTVDAHFAKALGANMWKKLKAENKLPEDMGPQQQHPAQQPPQQAQHRSPSSSPLQKPLAT
ncbi:unnamed protein product [Lymnaea stagnalis]|uniref:Transcription cofactor vestigial-like protein 4 n=1 Tax=Lymnaea stagnalis TaxID=6523 RepID=A0AAV2HN49_LYMST